NGQQARDGSRDQCFDRRGKKHEAGGGGKAELKTDVIDGPGRYRCKYGGGEGEGCRTMPGPARKTGAQSEKAHEPGAKHRGSRSDEEHEGNNSKGRSDEGTATAKRPRRQRQGQAGDKS